MIDVEVVEDRAEAGPETALWSALHAEPREGLSVRELMDATGMGRTWVYDRLQDYTRDGRVVQVSRGRWRASTKET